MNRPSNIACRYALIRRLSGSYSGRIETARRVPAAGDLDAPTSAPERYAALTGSTPASTIASPTAPPSVNPYDAGADVADGASSRRTHLAVEHQRLGIVDEHLHEPARQRAGRLAGDDGVAADEAVRLVEIDGEAEPGLEHRSVLSMSWP